MWLRYGRPGSWMRLRNKANELRQPRQRVFFLRFLNRSDVGAKCCRLSCTEYDYFLGQRLGVIFRDGAV